MATRTVSKFMFPRAPAPAPVAAPVAPVVVTSQPVTVAPRSIATSGEFISHYDPSRVIDLDRLKVVTDIRQSGSERGETQTGDNGTLGPGSTSGAIAPPQTGAPGAPGTAMTKNALIPIALMVAAFVLFGG